MANTIIGRKREKEELINLYHSKRAEFVTVYGRRRVGKTFLINNHFENNFTFKVTAIHDNSKELQLKNFATSLFEYSKLKNSNTPLLSDWFDAFGELRKLIEKSKDKRKVIFFDEMPWFDTKKSNFISAFEHFWNGWASTQNDILLIVCGSAASWIVKKLFRNRGGLHNRITRRILLQPFSLAETRLYAHREGLPVDEVSLLETYMTFGGIPYYLSLLNSKSSLMQNINQLCFTDGGELRDEYNNLYASLFGNTSRHVLVVEALGKKKSGLTREEIKNITRLPEGGSLSAILEDLELSGFIRKYAPFMRSKKGMIYQLIDHFTLFHLAFIKGSSTNMPDFWIKMRDTAAFYAWRGYAFEQVCLSHVPQIIKALGVSGVISHVESWRSGHSTPGAQIDLLINRNDRVISLCEMKFSDSEYSITKKTAQELRNKRNVFIEETETKKTVQIALITPFGLKRNDYFDMVHSVVTAEDLMND